MHVRAATRPLVLRPVETADAPFLLRLLNEPSWIENIGDRGVRTLADAERYVDDNVRAHHRKHGFGMLVVTLASGEPIGLCGLVRRDTLPGPDLGFALLPEHAGHGYAQEAAEAAMQHARSHLGIARLYAIVMHHNTRSIRLLERLGFTHAGAHRTPQGEDLLLYVATL